APEVVLAQRRALVRPLGLGPDQSDLAVEPAGAKLLRCFGAGQARADDHELLLAHLPLPPVRLRNSSRVRESSRTSPCSADVIVTAPGFCTPRNDRQRCSASSTTPTPFGCSCS